MSLRGIILGTGSHFTALIPHPEVWIRYDGIKQQQYVGFHRPLNPERIVAAQLQNEGVVAAVYEVIDLQPSPVMQSQPSQCGGTNSSDEEQQFTFRLERTGIRSKCTSCGSWISPREVAVLLFRSEAGTSDFLEQKFHLGQTCLEGLTEGQKTVFKKTKWQGGAGRREAKYIASRMG